MTGMVRTRYMLEFKQEAVRLVRGAQFYTSPVPLLSYIA